MKKIVIPKNFAKECFKKLTELEDEFYAKVEELEKVMQKVVGDDEVEFFWMGEGFVGIGTPSNSDKMDLVDRFKWEDDNV